MQLLMILCNFLDMAGENSHRILIESCGNSDVNTQHSFIVNIVLST